jgi:hypothetical protein
VGVLLAINLGDDEEINSFIARTEGRRGLGKKVSDSIGIGRGSGVRTTPLLEKIFEIDHGNPLHRKNSLKLSESRFGQIKV